MKKAIRLAIGIPCLLVAVVFMIAAVSLLISGDLPAAIFSVIVALGSGYGAFCLLFKKSKEKQLQGTAETAIAPIEPAPEPAPIETVPEPIKTAPELIKTVPEPAPKEAAAEAPKVNSEAVSFDFVAVDFETAYNDNNSACSIGLVCVKDLEIAETAYYLIKPPKLAFDDKNVEIHGITSEMVANEPQFPAIWERISKFFDGSAPIVAHNAQFDMSVLHECLSAYNIDMPEFEYLDSITISDRVCDEVGRSLAARAEHFGIDMGEHHNAFDDAVTCARIVIEAVKTVGSKSFSAYLRRFYSIRAKRFSELKPQKYFKKPASYPKLDLKSLSATEPVDESSVFFGKKVVITGEFARYSREELAQILVNKGAIIKSSAVRSLDYLIVGTQDPAKVGASGLSSKEKRVAELIEQGYDIKIIHGFELDAYLK